MIESLWLLAAMVMGLVWAAAAVAGDATFHVSPQGDDAWSGRLAEPLADGRDGPFRTIDAARRAVRAMDRAALKQPVIVQLRGGRYELDTPLVVEPADSGSAGAPVIYESFPGEQAVISGGRVVPMKAGDDGLWVADLPAEGPMRLRRIFVDGVAAYRPRLPAEGFFRVAGFAGADPKAKYNTPADRFEFAVGDIRADWRNLTDIEVVVLHFWVDTHLPIQAVDESTRTVTFARKSRRRFTDDHTQKGARYFVENVREAIRPGEFYHDRTAGQLYYRPRPGEQPDKTTVVVPRLTELVRFAGEPAAGRFVEHIQFRNVTFAETNWDLAGTDAGDLQAAVGVPGAIVGEGMRSCVVERCRLVRLGTYGIELRGGCTDNRIVGNEITDLAAGGVKLSGSNAAGPEAMRTGRNIVADNHMHGLGRVFPSAVGILSQHSFGNTFAHNHIHDLYYTGISVGWVWGYAASVSRDNIVEFNHIHDVGKGLLSDMGGIYTLGVSPGTVIRNNLIHDIESHGYGGWGIYTDEGSTGIVIENNIVYRTKSGGFHQHYGRENVIRNNIFAFAREGQVIRSREEEHLSFTFERNIVYFAEGPALGGKWTNGQFKLAGNVYFSTGGKPVLFPGNLTLAQWQEKGHDAGSVEADPRFADPARGDFALKAGSPALLLGFRPIDLSAAGPRR